MERDPFSGMKFIDEYADPELVKKLVHLIQKDLEDISRPVNLMEVCGTHTMSIGRSGIRSIVPDKLKLLSGPGCPVCVTPSGYISASIELAEREEVLITTFGDMVRVPNSSGDTLGRFPKEKVRIVYSPLEAITIAMENPDKEVVFLGVGFETTAPVIAQTIKVAVENKLPNFTCLSANKIIPPALKALADNPLSKIDGFILPGHVSIILGKDSYTDLGIRGVVSGFEPLDILTGIHMLLRQIRKGIVEIENAYSRAVTDKGNELMQKVMNEVFEIVDTPWRGLGVIPATGLGIRKEYSDYDAEKKFKVKYPEENEPAGCRCGEILQGICIPTECPLFGNKCLPDNPVGPCMVSSEGACSAYYKYERN